MDEIDYTSHLLAQGYSGRWDHPWTMSEEDAQAEYDELQARLARKRPIGFAAWPAGTEPVPRGHRKLAKGTRGKGQANPPPSLSKAEKDAHKKSDPRRGRS